MVRCEEPLDGVFLSVGVDHADVRVPAWGSVELRKRPEEMRQEDPVHAAVTDDQDRLAWALARQAFDRAERPRKNLLERFTAGPRDEAVVVPARQALGLVEGLAGPVTDIDLKAGEYERIRKSSGDVVWIPAGRKSTFLNATADPARLIVVLLTPEAKSQVALPVSSRELTPS